MSTEAGRRVPTQARSRRRVADLLDAAARLVVEVGVERLSTRDIAAAAGVPVASLYQYFADKEAILLALAERDMAEMDAQVAGDLGVLVEGLAPAVPSVGQVVRSVVGSFVTVFHRRRAFVEIYLRGRSNQAVHRFGRAHNARVADALLDFATEMGIAGPGMSHTVVRLAVDAGDATFQLAFETDDGGDPMIIEQGTEMLVGWLERYAA